MGIRNLGCSPSGGALTQNNRDKPKRHYQIWKGSNRFFCGGRLTFGPDVASLFLSAFFIAGPAIAFFMQMYMKIKDKNAKHVDK